MSKRASSCMILTWVTVIFGWHAPAGVDEGGPAQPTAVGRPGPAAIAAPIEPACGVSLGPNREVLVAGQATGLDAEFDDDVRLRNFAWRDDEILIAVGRAHPWRNWIESTQQHTLWRVPCADPSAKVVELYLEGADFSWAEASPEGRGLYFSFGGVQFYEYATQAWGPVIAPPQLNQCWMAESPVTADEYVSGWAGPGVLALLSGGPCGFEAEWLGAAVVIELHPELAGSAAGQPHRRPAAHVASLAASAKGRLWLANGGLCAAAQTQRSRGASGLWRSDDDGDRWDFVEIPELDGAGVDAVWAAASAPDRLLIRSECCYVEAADFCPGGKLLRSDDGGASWARISPADGGTLPGDPNSYGPVAELRVGAQLLELEAVVITIEGDEGRLPVRSADGGQSWAPLKPAREIQASPVARELELHGWSFAAGTDGLHRRKLGDLSGGQGDVVLRPLVVNIGH